MGIYLPNMKMPTSGELLVIITPNGDVKFKKSVASMWDRTTAVPVLSHGKLKDADAIERNLLKMQQAQTGSCSHGVRKSRAVLRDAPTIIQADEQEEETE